MSVLFRHCCIFAALSHTSPRFPSACWFLLTHKVLDALQWIQIDNKISAESADSEQWIFSVPAAISHGVPCCCAADASRIITPPKVLPLVGPPATARMRISRSGVEALLILIKALLHRSNFSKISDQGSQTFC